MNRKSRSSKLAADKLVKNIRRKTRQTYSAEEKTLIVLGVCVARKVFPHYAAVRALQKACITVGQKSFWRQVNAPYRVIRRVKQLRLK